MKTIIILIAISTLAFTSCSTTKTEAAGTTTTTTTMTQTGDAAVAAAIQIATTAANVAVQTYLTKEPQSKARLSRSVNAPAINAARRSTESEIREALPTISPLKVHNIVSRAYAVALSKNS